MGRCSAWQKTVASRYQQAGVCTTPRGYMSTLLAHTPAAACPILLSAQSNFLAKYQDVCTLVGGLGRISQRISHLHDGAADLPPVWTGRLHGALPLLQRPLAVRGRPLPACATSAQHECHASPASHQMRKSPAMVHSRVLASRAHGSLGGDPSACLRHQRHTSSVGHDIARVTSNTALSCPRITHSRQSEGPCLDDDVLSRAYSRVSGGIGFGGGTIDALFSFAFRQIDRQIVAEASRKPPDVPASAASAKFPGKLW